MVTVPTTAVRVEGFWYDDAAQKVYQLDQVDGTVIVSDYTPQEAATRLLLKNKLILQEKIRVALVSNGVSITGNANWLTVNTSTNLSQPVVAAAIKKLTAQNIELTKQVNALIKLVLGDTISIDGT